MEKNLTENLPIEELIGIDHARKLNTAFLDYVKGLSLSDVEKDLLTTPVIIEEAESNFTYIFSRKGYVGMKAYPGLGVKDGKPFFTLIFIGCDAKGDNIIRNTGSTQSVPLPTGSRTDDPIQDNNSPCKPPCKPLL